MLERSADEGCTASLAERRALCFMAAALHFCVFVQAAINVATTLRMDLSAPAGALHGLGYSIEPLVPEANKRHWALFVCVLAAYGWDVLIVLGRRVVPYSRCKRGSEILAHHLPVMLVILPLGVPYMTGYCAFLEPALPLIGHRMALLLRADSWAFLSSLNEVIMCLQNVWDPLLQSRAVCLFEMSFKVLIFTFFATMSLKHGFQFGVELWLAATSRPDGTVWSAAFTLARSPTCIRTCVWTCFILLNYPSMARRACSRCQKVYEADKDKDKDA